jgi:CheY-like chemotaxis protein
MNWLLEWKCRSYQSTRGEEAFSLLKKAELENDPFQTILIDRLMPGMDGMELSRRIKADKDLQNIPIIIMTFMGQVAPPTKLDETGIHKFLNKPIRYSQLHDTLTKVLGKPSKIEERVPTSQTNILNQPDGNPRGRVRILLAEDNPVNQLVAMSLLKKLGYQADTVANGLEALKALQSIPYNLVLMDCQMPEMDGFDATRAIRSADSKALDPRIPVIALTAFAMSGDRERCLEAGMDDYLSKPIKPQELGEVVEKWLTKTVKP